MEQASHSPMLTNIPASLDVVRIPELPKSAYYVSEFISPEEEDYLLDKIATAPKPRWKHLSHRRLQSWPSDLTKNTLLESPLPKWLAEPIVPRLQAIRLSEGSRESIFTASPHRVPNHVLINEYLPGQGIMPHKDGPAYYPVVCTISLGAPLCLDIYSTKADGTREDEPRWKILQEPRSLLVTTDEFYTEFLHGIADVTEDVDLSLQTVANWALLRSTDSINDGRLARKTRTSLTFRDVIKVSSLSKFGLFGKR